MTRINAIRPEHLLDQHLMAEYRELPMVNAALRRSLASPNWLKTHKRISPIYLLGPGHVMFFYNKGPWLQQRWEGLIDELDRRHFAINPDARNVDFSMFDDVDPVDWQPTQADITLSYKRILLRVSQNPEWYRYKGRVMPYKHYKRSILERYGIKP